MYMEWLSQELLAPSFRVWQFRYVEVAILQQHTFEDCVLPTTTTRNDPSVVDGLQLNDQDLLAR